MNAVIMSLGALLNRRMREKRSSSSSSSVGASVSASPSKAKQVAQEQTSAKTKAMAGGTTSSSSISSNNSNSSMKNKSDFENFADFSSNSAVIYEKKLEEKGGSTSASNQDDVFGSFQNVSFSESPTNAKSSSTNPNPNPNPNLNAEVGDVDDVVDVDGVDVFASSTQNVSFSQERGSISFRASFGDFESATTDPAVVTDSFGDFQVGGGGGDRASTSSPVLASDVFGAFQGGFSRKNNNYISTN